MVTTKVTTKQQTLPTKKLIVVWQNLPSVESTTWLADATADQELLNAALGRPLIDRTPQGRLQLVKPAIQVPIDVTRRTEPSVLQALLRGVLVDRPDCRKLGVICHRPHVDAVKNLGKPFASRVIRVAYFGSGEDRASNTWYSQCDLIVIAGTPRVNPAVVRERLCHIGEFDAANEVGKWGSIQWSGMTESGRSRAVNACGYAHPKWAQAHRSIVQAGLLQAVGRGRGVLANGCDVLVLSTEQAGLTLCDGPGVKPLNESEAAALNALTELAPNKSLLETSSVSAQELSSWLSLSDRQVRKLLSALEARGLAQRVGQRGGWLPVEGNFQ